MAKALVLVAAQEDGRRIGRIRLHRLEDASSASLIPAVKNCVEPGSLVRTGRLERLRTTLVTELCS